MSRKLQELRDQLLELPPEERQQLVSVLWDSLARDYIPDTSPEWRAELQRRAIEMEENPAVCIDGEQAVAELRAKCR